MANEEKTQKKSVEQKKSTESKKNKSTKSAQKKSVSAKKKDFLQVVNKDFSKSFMRTVRDTLEIEGVFSDNEDDPGGKTKYGITESTARRAGYDGKMKDLSKDEAIAIYHEFYWNRYLQKISTEFYPIANEVFDTAVNAGPKTAVRFLQISLNKFNNQETSYDDITVDGLIGPKTLSAFMDFKKDRGNSGCKVLYKALNCLQGAYYFNIEEKNEKLESFEYGWFLNRVKLEV